MNGQEIEHMLNLIDVNIAANQNVIKDEMLRFIETHQDEVLTELRATETARIPTSIGTMTLRLSDLRELAA